MKGSKKFELNLNIEFKRLVLFMIFYSRKCLGITCTIHVQEGGTEIIPSRLLIPSRLEKSAYRGGQKSPRLIFYPVLAFI